MPPGVLARKTPLVHFAVKKKGKTNTYLLLPVDCGEEEKDISLRVFILLWRIQVVTACLLWERHTSLHVNCEKDACRYLFHCEKDNPHCLFQCEKQQQQNNISHCLFHCEKDTGHCLFHCEKDTGHCLFHCEKDITPYCLFDCEKSQTSHCLFDCEKDTGHCLFHCEKYTSHCLFHC